MGEWTVETLKEYMNQRFIDSDKALGTAREAMEHRLDALNELRAVVTAAQSSFATKEELEHGLSRFPSNDAHAALVANVAALQTAQERTESERRNRNLTLLGAVVGSIASSSLVAFVIGHVH